MQNLFLSLTVLSVAAGSITSAATPDYLADVAPIFQERCVKCHGPEKLKGKLRLDSREAILKGGSSGPAVVPGKAEESELLRRISLPRDDTDAMPPETEGDPLTPAQIELLRAWIKEGAPWNEAAVPAPAPKPEARAESAKTAPVPDLPPNYKPGPNESNAVARLAALGVPVREIARDLPWRYANFRLQGTNITDASLTALRDLQSLVELNLATTRITDAGLTNLSSLTNLQRLHIELTSITDAGLVQVKPLGRLFYLNLYGTQVTDAGLELLKSSSNLHQVYLWQTKATPAGIENLRKSLPHAHIVAGESLAASTNAPAATASK
jgi:mono/diheme cytochrome c family protein